MCEIKFFFANSLLRIVKFVISHANANSKNLHLFTKYANYSHISAKLYISVYNWVIFVCNFVLYRNNYANKCKYSLFACKCKCKISYLCAFRIVLKNVKKFCTSLLKTIGCFFRTTGFPYESKNTYSHMLDLDKTCIE